jgi:glycosyltransferase involved in cell wall biosynthesis
LIDLEEEFMKIAILITLSELGGAQSHVYILIKHLISRGIEVSLAVGKSGWLSDRVHKIGGEVTIINSLVHPIRPHKDLLAVMHVRRWLAEECPDCLHCHSSKAGLVGRVAAKTLKIPTVFTAHGWAFTEGASLKRKLIAIPLEKIISHLTGMIICVSYYDYMRAVKFKIAKNSLLKVIHNGIDDTDYRTTYSDRPPKIVCVARFAPPKQQTKLVEALSFLNDRSWTLKFIGDGPDQTHVMKKVKALGLEHRVQFLGARDDVPRLLAESDIFVLPSFYEGLPISIIEAMRAGLPVIASNVGGVNELLNSKTGILIENKSEVSLKNALLKLIEDTQLRKRLGKGGRFAYESFFRSNEMVNEYIKIYKKLNKK